MLVKTFMVGGMRGLRKGMSEAENSGGETLRSSCRTKFVPIRSQRLVTATVCNKVTRLQLRFIHLLIAYREKYVLKKNLIIHNIDHLVGIWKPVSNSKVQQKR